MKHLYNLLYEANLFLLALNIIRNQGRQEYHETNPANFSRIVHNYSNAQKGFIIWKDLLQEQLV